MIRTSILIGAAAFILLAFLAIGRKNKLKNSIKEAAHEGLLTQTAIRLLHHAKRAAVREMQAKLQ